MLKLSFPQPEADLMARTPIFVAITAVSIGIGMILVGIPINRKANKKKALDENKDEGQNSIDDRADNVEPPDSPDAGYDYKPLPYEKAIAMNGMNNNPGHPMNGGPGYSPLKNDDPDADSVKIPYLDDNEIPLYEKMRKTSKETDV